MGQYFWGEQNVMENRFPAKETKIPLSTCRGSLLKTFTKQSSTDSHTLEKEGLTKRNKTFSLPYENGERNKGYYILSRKFISSP
jgi:hypothetical protein